MPRNLLLWDSKYLSQKFLRCIEIKLITYELCFKRAQVVWSIIKTNTKTSIHLKYVVEDVYLNKFEHHQDIQIKIIVQLMIKYIQAGNVLGQAQLKLELELYFTSFKICCIKLIQQVNLCWLGGATLLIFIWLEMIEIWLILLKLATAW